MISPVIRQQLQTILLSDGKMAAIKFAKAELRCGLREAIHVVDAIANGETVARQATYEKTTHDSPSSSFARRSLQPKTFLPQAISAMCFAVAMLLFAGVWYVGHRNADLESRGEKTVATVVAMSSGGSNRAPIFEYSWKGDTKTIESNVSTKPPSYEVGDTAILFVDPDRPSRVLVDDFLHRRFLQIFLTIFGVALFLPIILLQVLFGGRQ